MIAGEQAVLRASIGEIYHYYQGFFLKEINRAENR